MTAQSGEERAGNEAHLKIIRSAEGALDSLRAVMDQADLRIPGMRISPVTWNSDAPRPLIDLGCVTPETASRLVALVLGGLRSEDDDDEDPE